MREAATGNARSPTADSSVDGTISAAVDDDYLLRYKMSRESRICFARLRGGELVGITR